MQPTLVVAALANLTAAALLASIGYGLARRPARGREALIASSALVTWWYLFAAEALLDGLSVTAAVAGAPSLALVLTIARLKVLVAAVAMWALAYYVLFLHTGSRNLLGVALGGAIVHTVLYLVLFEHQVPVGFETGLWGARVTVAQAAASGGSFAGALAYVLFYGPPILFALLCTALVPQIGSQGTRFRLTAMAAVVLLWHASAVVIGNPNVPLDAPVVPAMLTLSVLAALIAFLAHYPPAALRRRLGVASLVHETEASTGHESSM